MHGRRPVSIGLPPHVTLKIVEADPAMRGQTAASSCKPAVLENGLRALVRYAANGLDGQVTAIP